MPGKTVFLAAGGTGGHVFPAIAVAEALHASGHIPVLITDTRGVKYASDWPGGHVFTLPAARLNLKRWWRLPAETMQLLRGVRQCRRVLKELKPISVVGFGGYPAFPAGIAAKIAGRPLLLHEQNTVLGRSNRLLSVLADRVLLSFARTQRIPAKAARKTQLVGTPVRRVTLQLANPYSLPLRDTPWKLVVVGGSLGAQALSLYVPSAVGLLPEEIRFHLQVVHQARAEDLCAVQQAYHNIAVQAEVAPFFPNILEHLAGCHLAITRAGASTLAELATLGRPAILVPYPQATDGHQASNAASFGDAGAAWLLPQSLLSPENLAAKLKALLTDTQGLAIAAVAMRTLAHPEAALTVGQLALHDEKDPA